MWRMAGNSQNGPTVHLSHELSRMHGKLCNSPKKLLCGGPVLEGLWTGLVYPLQLGDKSPMITDQHTAGGSVSQLSQLTKLSPWLSLSTKDITPF